MGITNSPQWLTNMKPISQSAAWTLLAQTWKNPIPALGNGFVPSVKCIVSFNNDTFAGLCDCIRKLFTTGQIRESIKDRMLDAIFEQKDDFGCFRWSTDYKGAKQRVRFCQKMARKTKRKKT